MNRVVVTDATSMIGTALIEECVKNKIEVLAIIRGQSARRSRLPESEFITLLECPLEELNTLDLSLGVYDVFYHFAWDYTAKQYRGAAHFQEKNIICTLEAVELTNRLGCKKFLGAGSQAEYGKVEGVMNENTPLNPITSYGIAKYTAGKLSEILCEKYGMIHIWGRIFSVYGSNDNEGTMINYAIDWFEKGLVAEFSSATHKWKYINEKDAGMIFYLLGAKSVEGGNYCVANNKSRILREYIEELRQVFGKETICEFAPVESQVKEIELDLDIKKTINAIGFIPQITFKEGIKKIMKNSGGGKSYKYNVSVAYTLNERCIA